MPDQLVYAIEVFLNGLMAGVLYALVALGFVLIYKASATFNFAQGAMVFFAVFYILFGYFLDLPRAPFENVFFCQQPLCLPL